MIKKYSKQLQHNLDIISKALKSKPKTLKSLTKNIKKITKIKGIE